MEQHFSNQITRHIYKGGNRKIEKIISSRYRKTEYEQQTGRLDLRELNKA